MKDEERDAEDWLGLSLGEKITMLKDRGLRHLNFTLLLMSGVGRGSKRFGNDSLKNGLRRRKCS